MTGLFTSSSEHRSRSYERLSFPHYNTTCPGLDWPRPSPVRCLPSRVHRCHTPAPLELLCLTGMNDRGNGATPVIPHEELTSSTDDDIRVRRIIVDEMGDLR